MNKSNLRNTELHDIIERLKQLENGTPPSSIPIGWYGWFVRNLSLIASLIALFTVIFLSTDAWFSFSPIPAQYYRIPQEGDSFPVKGTQFWILMASVFLVTILDSMFGLLYVVWRWRRAYKESLPVSETFFTIAGLETFLAITKTFLVLLSVGHVLFLVSGIFGRMIVMIATVSAKPFAISSAKSVGKQYTKYGYSRV